jgi:putative molybdopterin biosynthesis protein
MAFDRTPACGKTRWRPQRAPDLVIMGSHDIALDVVVGALAERGVRARTVAVGSLAGVSAASRGECDIAPVHLVDAATGVYNKHLLTPGLALVPGWRRMQGFVFRSGDGRFHGRSAEAAMQAALADPARISWSSRPRDVSIRGRPVPHECPLSGVKRASAKAFEQAA